MAAIHPFFCWWLAWGFQTPNISWGFFHKNHWGNPYKATKIYCWLVVWLPSILVSQKYWEFQIIPIDETPSFFQRGGYTTTNQNIGSYGWTNGTMGASIFMGGTPIAGWFFSWKKHPAGWWKKLSRGHFRTPPFGIQYSQPNISQKPIFEHMNHGN